MANLGFFQVQSMVELSLRLTEINQAKTLERNIKMLNIVTLTIVILNTTSMIVLATYFSLVMYRLYTYCYFDAAGNQICDSGFKGMTYLEFMKLLGGIGGFFYALLTLTLILSFIKLNKSMKKRFLNVELINLSKSIHLLFLVLVVSFTLRTIFLLFEGHYQYFVYQEYWRLQLQLVLWPFFDFLALCPILVMHHKNFGTVRPVKHNQTVNET